MLPRPANSRYDGGRGACGAAAADAGARGLVRGPPDVAACDRHRSLGGFPGRRPPVPSRPAPARRSQGRRGVPQIVAGLVGAGGRVQAPALRRERSGGPERLHSGRRAPLLRKACLRRRGRHRKPDRRGAAGAEPRGLPSALCGGDRGPGPPKAEAVVPVAHEMSYLWLRGPRPQAHGGPCADGAPGRRRRLVRTGLRTHAGGLRKLLRRRRRTGPEHIYASRRLDRKPSPARAVARYLLEFRDGTRKGVAARRV
mmetsp:Transcript_66436/g.185135  ORF Transcript_66436/g.185135 Transcript_66436/m.185135 type:complete len:255 (+) Transcript_66436:59-823(+)